MRILAGTSGWQYKEWKGAFYPHDLPVDRMLAYYADLLPTVEVNNTFYRLPRESVLRGWADQTPQGFAFVLKASQRITHHARLREEGADALDYLLRTAASLGERLGPFLFQLPPNLKKDAPRLAAFLERIPGGTRAAFDFRHASWFDDEVAELLSRREMALCVESTEETESPLRATAPYGYLHLRKEEYSEEELDEWAARILGEPWSEAFVFFKHEAGAPPSTARRFMEICAGRSTAGERPPGVQSRWAAPSTGTPSPETP